MNYAVIVAGGQGLRMGTQLPKQFLLVDDYPILFYTLKAFYIADPTIQMILVLPPTHQAYWQTCIQKHQISIPHTLVDGGDTRYQSVKNGLNHVPQGAYVAIHDGVRPMVTKELIDRCFDACKQFEGVIPVLPVTDSIRKVTFKESKAIDRAEYRMVQTPQCFRSEVIKKAYADVPYSESLTDDATVAEAFGLNIHLVDGEKKNIKITTPEDVLLFQMYLHYSD